MAKYQPTSGATVALSCIVCTKPFAHITKRGRYARFCGDECRSKRHAQQMRTAKRGPRKRHSRGCVECGAAFVTFNVRTICCGRVCGNLRGKRRGDEARAANTLVRLTKECKACGASFVMPRPNGKALRGEVNAGQFCSRRCANDGVQYASPGDAKRARRHRRRARIRCVPSERFAPSEIFERDEWRCGVCFCPVDSALAHPHPMSASLDHVTPLSKGGAHTRDNTQCAHLRCNVAKGAKLAA